MIRRILIALLFLIFLAVLELNKNSLWGWGAFLALSAGFFWWRELMLKRQEAAAGRVGVFFAWVILFAVIVILSWPPVKRVPAVSARDPKASGVITLAKGQVSGVYTEDGAVAVYAGIPYAKPPVGELRWKEPQDPEPWSGVLKADSFAPMSMQPTHLPIYDSLAQIIGYHDYEIRLDDNWRAPVSEDSLYVNVWQPAGAKEGDKIPVLVYIHGGSLQTGQPWYQDYNGETLARNGVIVVNMGYRLGIFGYLALEELAAESENGTSGNYGLLDQIKALEWVRDNIAAFGGDPDNVTLAGESAGAAAVSALCTSPLAKGLFRRAVLESSTVASPKPPHSFRSWEEALESGRELLKKQQVSSAAELRALPAEVLAKEADSQHHMTIDGWALEELPYESYLAGRHNEEALLHGFNKEESAPFILFSHANRKTYEKRVRALFQDYADEVLALLPASTDEEADRNWADIFSAAYFTYSHACLTRLAAANGIPVYEYYFSRDNGRLGSWHSGEEVYLYGNIPGDSKLYEEADYALSGLMTEYFLNFIKSGDPNGGALPRWEKSTDGISVMEFGDKTVPSQDPFRVLYGIFDKLQGFSLSR